MKTGLICSSTRSLRTGSLQGSVLCPLLYSLYTQDCTHPSNAIIKFTNDTTVVGLIHHGDESAYRHETQKLAAWCSDNLSLNTSKTKELVIDFRRQSRTIVERVPTFKYLGAQISEDLCWSANMTAVVKKAQQRLIFKRQHLFILPLSLWSLFMSIFVFSRHCKFHCVFYDAMTINAFNSVQSH